MMKDIKRWQYVTRLNAGANLLQHKLFVQYILDGAHESVRIEHIQFN